MEDYYAALGRVRPNTMRWIDAQGEIPRQSAIRALSSEAPRHNRYDAALLDDLKAELDRFLDGGNARSHGPTSEETT